MYMMNKDLHCIPSFSIIHRATRHISSSKKLLLRRTCKITDNNEKRLFSDIERITI